MQELLSVLSVLAPQIIAFRRDLHQYPELGWFEYRTTSKIAEVFENLGYDVVMGKHAINPDSRLTVPTAEKCAKEQARALLQGASPQHMELMGHSLTGLWVDMHFSAPCSDINEQKKINKFIAFRFDIDATEVQEEFSNTHAPAQHCFVSEHKGVMHACGHDGHAAIGIGLGLVLHALRAKLETVPDMPSIRLIFQPAEEIGQGARAMLDANVMQGVQEIYGLHLGVQAMQADQLICSTTHFMVNTVFEVNFHGKSAHSALAPHEGRNALLAAATAVQGLHALPRHGHGQSRINVGELYCNGSPNVIPATAKLVGETRGITAEINDWLASWAEQVCHGAATMWQCSLTFQLISKCIDGFSDISLAKEIKQIAQTMPYFNYILESGEFLASEDFTWFLKEVQNNNGCGSYIQLGIDGKGGHHTKSFDFDEQALLRGVELLARIILKKLI